MAKRMKGAMMFVEWLDHSKAGDNADPRELSPVRRRTIGWVVKQDAVSVTLSPDRSKLGYEYGFCILWTDVLTHRLLYQVSPMAPRP